MSQKTFCNELWEEFESRQSNNPSYSLRAFGRSLGVDPSTLSQILRNKRKLTAKMKARIIVALGWDPSSWNQEGLEQSECAPLAQLNGMQAKALSDWLFDAILEYADSKEGLNPKKVSHHFGRSQLEVSRAIQMLVDLDLLDTTGEVKNRVGSSSTILDPEVETASGKAYQIKLMERSKNALENLRKKDRDHTSVVFKATPQDLDQIRKILTDCRQKLLAMSEKAKPIECDVYAVQLSAFPLSKPRNQIPTHNKRGQKNENKLDNH